VVEHASSWASLNKVGVKGNWDGARRVVLIGYLFATPRR
jgi:hypothetical protein